MHMLNKHQSETLTVSMPSNDMRDPSADIKGVLYLVLVPLSFRVEEVFAHLLSQDGHWVVDLKNTLSKTN